MPREATDPEVRFWMRVKSSKEGCWEFLSPPRDARRPHPTIGVNGKTIQAHRYSWQIHNGQIPDGMCVCHKCDNPRCVRPDHLFLGTQTDNRRDCVQKNRHAKGETARHAKLTESDVRSMFEMMNSGSSMREVANAFGVLKSTVHRAVTGRSWSHLGLKLNPGVLRPAKKIGDSELISIFQWHRERVPLVEIARRLDVDASHVCKIVNGSYDQKKQHAAAT